MITLHHLNNSRSQRILWLMEELGLPYEIQRYQRDPKTMLAPPSLRAVHPLGKSPVITDGEFTLAESGAIIDYLVGRYGAGRGREPTGAVAADQVVDDGARFGQREFAVGDHGRFSQRVHGAQRGRRQHGLGVALVAQDLIGQAQLLHEPEYALRAGVVQVVQGDQGVAPLDISDEMNAW